MIKRFRILTSKASPYYPLISIDSVAEFISKHGHLLAISSASEMKETPLNVGDFQIDLLQKTEELTLYMIEANKTIKEQNLRIEALENRLRSKF